MPSRMDVLRERAKPSRGSAEHQELQAELGGVEPGPDHPRYADFIRLTDPKPMGRPPGVVEQGPRDRIYPPRQDPAITRQKATEWTRQNREKKRDERRRALEQRLRSTQRQQEDAAAAQARVQELRGQGFIVSPQEEQRMMEQARQGRRASVDEILKLALSDSWEQSPSLTAEAAVKKKPKPKPPRKPEEVWYDVHKHPAGVPGGMGKSPEYHLRNRGWSGHDINGASRKTIQYHNPQFPDFVISYGGGTSQKPDHNFRVMYMGTNRNIPKVHHTYSVADAMNKVEELHSMQSDHVVQPLTAVQASAEEDPRATPSPFRGARVLADRGWTHVKPAPGLQMQEHFIRDGGKQKIIPPSREWPAWRTYHNGVMVGSHPDVNLAARAADDAKFYEQIPSAVDDTWEAMERELGEEFPHEAAAAQPKTFVAPATPPSQQRDMNDDNEHPIGPPKVDFPTQPEREHDWKKPRKQLQEIPETPKPKRSRVAAVYQIAEQDTWEEPFQKTALGDLRYGPGHPREGDLMSDDDASNYLMSFRTGKPKPEGISDLEHGEVMERIPQLDPSGSSEYSLWEPSIGVGSNKRVWLRADPEHDMFWHVGHDDREGNVVGSTQKSEPLEKALERVSNLGRSLGWL